MDHRDFVIFAGRTKEEEEFPHWGGNNIGGAENVSVSSGVIDTQEAPEAP